SRPGSLQFRLARTGGVKQEDYQSSALGPEGWRSGTGVEYEAGLLFLPEHPYHLEAFALRFEPLYKEQSATQHENVEESQGAIFRYRDKPWFADASYITERTHTGGLITDIDRFGADLEYSKRFKNGDQLTLTGAAHPTQFSDSTGLSGDSSEYLLGALIDLKSVRVDSNVAWNGLQQDSPSSGSLKSDVFHWYEYLTAYLPWNFRSDA